MDQPISDFIDTDSFGQAATYTPSGGGPASITIIFDNEFFLSTIAGSGYENTNPTALCKTTDVSTATNGATLVTDSVTYYVIGVQPDGTGFTKLILSTQN